jgi:hypothetical protein
LQLPLILDDCDCEGFHLYNPIQERDISKDKTHSISQLLFASMAKSDQITFESCGVTCAADLYLPDSSKFPYPRPGVVIGHGTAMIKQFLADQATHLAHAGYVTMAIDYRTFGESKGEPRAQLFPLDQVEDFRNALSHLEQRNDLVDPERIGI